MHAEEYLRLFQGNLEGVFRVFKEGCYEEVSRAFQRSYLDVFLSPKRQGSFKGGSRVFHRSFKGVLRNF